MKARALPAILAIAAVLLAVVPSQLQPLMVDYDRTVRHYEVIE